MTLDRKKIAIVHVAKAKLGLDDPTYRDVLRHVAGVESSTQLDDDGFRWLMDHFRRCGFESDWHVRNFGDRPGMASARQVALIRDLWSEYTDGAGSDLTLGKWLARTFGVAAVRFVTAALAPKAITALKAMIARKVGRSPPADGIEPPNAA